MRNIKLIINALQSLTIYRNLLQDPVMQAYMRHMQALVKPHEEQHPAHTYGIYYHLLADKINPMTDMDTMQNHLLDLIIEDVNPFSKSTASSNTDGQTFLPAVARDLSILRLLFDIKADYLQQMTTKALSQHDPLPHTLKPLPVLTAAAAMPSSKKNQTRPYFDKHMELKQQMLHEPHWERLATTLADYHATRGYGIYGRYIAFKWQNNTLQGIAQPDPIRLDQLVGYQEIKQKIIQNTLQFLHGHPANNMLLYGDRGTGKSSTTKALLNQYWPLGLRLVEVTPEQLVQFPAIIEQLQNLKLKFIIFVDDLSFEENETSYKNLKSLLEGGLAARPNNVLIYATSNRRHLIRETFADRESGLQDVHGNDTIQEKLSLADRFGLTIIFTTPDQQEFLAIVQGIAQQRQLLLTETELRQKALQWASWYNGRSPRSARQFIDELEGKLALEKIKAEEGN